MTSSFKTLNGNAQVEPNLAGKGLSDPRVAEIFARYTPRTRRKLLRLRKLILHAATITEGVGDLEETLRWGEPTYLTTASGSGSMVRINSRGLSGGYAMYFHCQTDLIATFQSLYPGQFRFEGNRAIVFDADDAVPEKQLCHCISLALTYHRNKVQRKRRR